MKKGLKKLWVIAAGKYNNMSLSRKLFSIFGISIGIGLILVAMALRFVVLAYDELLYEQTYESMSYFAGNLENKLSEIEKLAENNISNSIMQESLAELKEAEGWNSVRGTGICQIQREYMKCISD